MALKIEKFLNERFIFPPGIYKTIISNVNEISKMNAFIHQEEDLIQIELTVTHGELKDKVMFARVTPRLSPKSNLWSICEAAHGRQLKPEDIAPINTAADIAAFIQGLPVQVFVKNQTSRTGTTYYKIVEYMPSGTNDYFTAQHQPKPQPQVVQQPEPEVKKVEQPPMAIQKDEPIQNDSEVQTDTSDPTDVWLDDIPDAKPE